MLRKIRLVAALLFFTMITLLQELCIVGLAGWRKYSFFLPCWH